jgi:hypothetical protein
MGVRTMEHRYDHVYARTAPCLRQLARVLLIGLALAIAPTGAPRPQAEERARVLAILPFELHDTSGELGAPNRHDGMLATLTRSVGEKIAAAKLYDVVAEPRVAAAVEAVRPGTYLRQCNGCELDIAKRVGADRVMVAWIYKVSSLVLTLHVAIKDAATGEIVFARVFDFRGDNEKAWQRAADYMVKSLDGRT